MRDSIFASQRKNFRQAVGKKIHALNFIDGRGHCSVWWLTMMDSTDRSKSRKRRLGVSRAAAMTSDAAVRAGELWNQHCSWCPRCGATTPGCELGRKMYDVYDWLARVPTRLAG